MQAKEIVIGLIATLTPFSIAVLPGFSQQKVAPSGWVEDTAPVSKPANGATKTPLQGGIENSETLPALPHNLQTGAIFDEHATAQTDDQTGWYKIPDWLAGKWIREEETILSTYFYDSGNKQKEPRTIAEREIAEFGFQSDKSGQIWHRRLASKGVSDVGSYLAIAFVQSQEPLQVSDDLVVIRDVFIEVQVNKETNVIMHSSQAESITRYRQVHDGLIKTTMSVKVFKEDGSPYTLQKNAAFDKRMETFKTTDAFKGKNLRQDFANFLHSTGQDQLIP